MKLWPIFLLLLLVPQFLAGQGVTASTTREREGAAALANGLWEVAERHFREGLADPSLTPAAKSECAARLAESLIRSGNPAAALELLDQSYVSKNPEASFWKAHALVSQHQFVAAAALFSASFANPTAPHREEAGMTLASLELALDQPDASLATLAKLRAEATISAAVKIQIYQVEILLDLGRTLAARQAMPATPAVPAGERARVAFLEAQLLLKEGNPVAAEAGFLELVTHPQGQSLVHYHSAAIGLADAIAAQDQPEQAALSLLTFLQDSPTSPALPPMFQRLLEWLPAKPTATDPILEALGSDQQDPGPRASRWITQPTFPAVLPFDSTRTEIVAAWPVAPPISSTDEISAFAIYTRALGVRRIATPKALAESRHLMNRLLLEHPNHLLADRALYQLARWQLDAGAIDQAFSILNTVRDISKSSELKGEAAFVEARAAFLNGDSAQAIELFEEAALTLSAPDARTARLQAAIARLRSGNLGAVTLVQNQDPELEADLELERALTAAPASAGRPLLVEFLKRFPDHPRAVEARLAVTEAALTELPPDVAFVRSQLAILPPDEENFASRIALIRLRLTDLSKDTPATITAAQFIIDTYPSDPAAAEAALTLGRNLFQSGSYNPARLILEKLATTETNPSRAQAAWLLAARSAALGGTPQSRQQASTLFDEALKIKGPLTSIAMLEKAGHLIDTYQLQDASAFLKKWLKLLPSSDPLQLPAGLMLGEALYAQGSSNPVSLVEALAVYDQLLALAKDQPTFLNRLHYLRGITLEQLPSQKDPNQKREKEAFQAYHTALETTTAPAEWEYFERCGFSALALLEKANRWRAAITVAEKIASFQGPRAPEAAARASKLKLVHMVYED